MKKNLFLILISVSAITSTAQTAYQRPPEEIIDLIMARPFPTATFNDSGTLGVVMSKNSTFLPLDEIVSMDEYKVGGLRINANNFGDSRYKSVVNSISIVSVPSGKITDIAGMPMNPKISDVKWSPDGKVFCFLNTTPMEIELWRVDASESVPQAVKINAFRVNNTYGAAYKFLPDGKSIMYKGVPADAGRLTADRTPKGPVVQRSSGKKARYRTYQDLIKCFYDEEVYEFLCTSQLCLWDGTSTRTVGGKAVFRSFDPSPDGTCVLVVTEKRPYSYVKSHLSFGAWTSVWDMNGNEVKVFKKTPSSGISQRGEISGDDSLEQKKKTGGTRSSFAWRADEPCTLTWIETGKGEARDADGDDDDDKDKEKPEPTFTTSLWQFEYPFKGKELKRMILKSEYRMSDVIWCSGDLAIYTETNRKEKFKRYMAFSPSDTSGVAEELFRYSTEHDTLGNAPVIGKPLTRIKNGCRTLSTDGSTIFFIGDNRPDAEGDNMSFIDAFSLKSRKTANLWTGKAPYSEAIAKVVNPTAKKVTFISRKQSNKEVPNYHLVTVRGRRENSDRFTDFENTLPRMLGVIDTFITYRRADGVKMTGRLYLPEGYDKERDGKLPVLMWTYPYEYQCRAEAEKFRTPRYTYPVPGRSQLMHWATKGYAVFMGFSMPIIAKELKGKPNDNLVEQMVMNAEAALNCLDSLGYGDRNRAAVGGHSYGAFMTANLLTHSKLFKAGFAESGAYNRSLTPFGFQHEDRTYWKAMKMYNAVSPFNFADKLSGHLMLVHGTMDENTGTHPIQSERMYYAAAGAGKDADYIQLPYECHTYCYIENVLHNVNEQWKALEKYVKNAAPED